MIGANGSVCKINTAFCGGTRYFLPPDKPIHALISGLIRSRITVSQSLCEAGWSGGVNGWFSSGLGIFSTVSRLRRLLARQDWVFAAKVGVLGQESAERFGDCGQVFEQALDGRGQRHVVAGGPHARVVVRLRGDADGDVFGFPHRHIDM